MERRQVKRRAYLKEGRERWHATGRWIAVGALCSLAASCGGGGESIPPPAPPPPVSDTPFLEPDEIRAIMELAARATPEDVAIAVTDRKARILGVSTNFPIDRNSCKTPTCIPGNQGCEAACGTATPDCQTVSLATQLARTAGLFSADQIFLTS